MISMLRGQVFEVGNGFFVLDCDGVGYKVFSHGQAVSRLLVGTEVRAYCSLSFRNEKLELFGFLEREALTLFEMLISVSGVGPRTGLAILDVDTVPGIIAAIVHRRPDLLTRVSGIGKKTAERVILELQGKLSVSESERIVKTTDVFVEAEDVLVGLGYTRAQVRGVLQEFEGKAGTFEETLRLALKKLAKS